MKQEKIKAYIIRVDEEKQYKGYFQLIDNTLEAKQAIVGGLIEVVSLTPELDIIINEEGKLRGLPINRMWLSEEGEPIDILVGNIIVVRHEADEFTDIIYNDYTTIEELLIPIKKVRVLATEDSTVQNVIFRTPQSELFDYGEECEDDED